jgi:hypothetical protein
VQICVGGISSVYCLVHLLNVLSYDSANALVKPLDLS